MTVIAFKRSGDQEQMAKKAAKPKRTESTKMRWYLIRVAGPREKAFDELRRAGIEKRVIIHRHTYRHKRTHQLIHRSGPLLGAYVFVHMPALDPNWLRLKSCQGVESIMSVSNKTGEHHPFYIPRWVVIDLFLRQRRGDFDETGFTKRDRREKTRRVYGKGKVVRINEGAFASFSGIIERVSKTGALDVLIDIFGRSTPVHFHEIDVEAGAVELISDAPRAA